MSVVCWEGKRLEVEMYRLACSLARVHSGLAAGEWAQLLSTGAEVLRDGSWGYSNDGLVFELSL
jgi:hypothetical protein